MEERGRKVAIRIVDSNFGRLAGFCFQRDDGVVFVSSSEEDELEEESESSECAAEASVISTSV